MVDSPDHRDTVRTAFTKQADAYAANENLSDTERLARLVDATGVREGDRVLEIATGPGHVAFAFADRCETVVGVDLTDAPLRIARSKRRERNLDNVHFVKGDAETVPFPDDHFDAVVCRFSIHHVERPDAVIEEMARVCRSGGRVTVADQVASEHPDRAAYYNRFERLRDPSHVRSLPLSELIGHFAEAGLEVTSIETNRSTLEVNEWLENAQTPDPQATEANELIRRAATEDLSGTRPFRRDGELYFSHLIAIVVGRVID